MNQTDHKLYRYSYAMLSMSRPLFLTGILPLYMLGIAMAWNETKSVHLPLLVTGLVFTWLVQLMTHYNNEYCDLKTDRATGISTRISGGSRVLVQGLVPVTVARIAAIICLLLAGLLVSAIILFHDAGALLPVLVVPSIFVGWFYSSHPIKLVSRGMGEVSIVMVTCFLLPITGYCLQTSTVTIDMILLGIPLGLLTFALTLTVELPDLAADMSTGKITLAARLGLKKSLKVQFISFIIGYICFIITAVFVAESWAWAIILISIPIAIPVLFLAGSKRNSQIATIEKLGMGEAIMIGYASILFSGALFLN